MINGTPVDILNGTIIGDRDPRMPDENYERYSSGLIHLMILEHGGHDPTVDFSFFIIHAWIICFI